MNVITVLAKLIQIFLPCSNCISTLNRSLIAIQTIQKTSIQQMKRKQTFNLKQTQCVDISTFCLSDICLLWYAASCLLLSFTQQWVSNLCFLSSLPTIIPQPVSHCPHMVTPVTQTINKTPTCEVQYSQAAQPTFTQVYYVYTSTTH